MTVFSVSHGYLDDLSNHLFEIKDPKVKGLSPNFASNVKRIYTNYSTSIHPEIIRKPQLKTNGMKYLKSCISKINRNIILKPSQIDYEVSGPNLES